MSTVHHTPIATGAAANAATINSPLGQLDQAIIDETADRMAADNDLQGQIDAIDATLVAAGGLAPTTLAADASGGTLLITVADSSGFAVGSYVDIELDSGDLHATTVADISGNNITVADALPGSGVVASTGNIVSQVPAEVALARTALKYGGRMRPVLDDAMEWAGGGVYNVKAFGAIGDGASHPLSDYYATLLEAQADYPHATSLTNEIDWAAIQLAIDTATANEVVYLPAGEYLIDQSIKMRSGIAFVGAGRSATLVTYSGAGAAMISFDAATARRFVQLRDFTLQTSTGALGIDVAGLINSRITNVRVLGFSSVGIKLNAATVGCWWNYLDDVVVRCGTQGANQGTGILLTGSTMKANNNYISGTVQFNAIGVHIEHGNANVIRELDFEDNDLAFRDDHNDTAWTTNVIRGCRFEDNTTNLQVSSSTKNGLYIGPDNHFASGIQGARMQNPIGAVQPTALTNYIYNGDFEASTYNDGWSASGTGVTPAEETTTRFTGKKGVKLTANGNNSNYQWFQNIPGYEWFANQKVTLVAHVKTAKAGKVTARLTDGTTTTNSATHSGSDDWERLVVRLTVGSAPSQLHAGVQVASDNSGTPFDVYIDKIELYVGVLF